MMPMPLPCRPDWLRTKLRAAAIRSSIDFGGLKYDGQRGSGYDSPVAPARVAALAESARPLSARPHAAATITVVRNTTVSSVTAREVRVMAYPSKGPAILLPPGIENDLSADPRTDGLAM